MKRDDWKQAYEPVPAALERRVRETLDHLDDTPQAEPVRRISRRTLVIAMALALALGGVAYAMIESKTADLFGWFYGGSWQQELENGDFAVAGQSCRAGDATYTLEEMVYKTQGDFQGLYGVVRIAPAQGANVILLSEDLSVDDPAEYLLHYADTGETIDREAPSYAELAREKGAKLLVARAAVNTVSVNGQACQVDVGENWLPQKDGTLLGTLEITGDLPAEGLYELTFQVSNWESTQEGLWLRDDAEDTSVKQEWTVTVTPEKKGA